VLVNPTEEELAAAIVHSEADEPVEGTEVCWRRALDAHRRAKRGETRLCGMMGFSHARHGPQHLEDVEEIQADEVDEQIDEQGTVKDEL
jgi:hypothetical protein